MSEDSSSVLPVHIEFESAKPIALTGGKRHLACHAGFRLPGTLNWDDGMGFELVSGSSRLGFEKNPK
jgi:hypothetical protein